MQGWNRRLIDSQIECTSAVSSDVEGKMYEHAKTLGITLITISIRCAVVKLAFTPSADDTNGI